MAVFRHYTPGLPTNYEFEYTVINSSQPYLARVYVKMYKTVVEAYVFFFSFEGAVVVFYSYWCETEYGH